LLLCSVFNTQLKAQDTVCLFLYKRVFPRWKAELYHGQSLTQGTASDEDDDADMQQDDE